MKDWFKRGTKGSSKAPDTGPTVDDLIVLERYEEAEQALRAELKRTPKDLRRRLQLGSVLANMRRVDDALEQFFFVADAYVQDGFQEKAIALLQSAKRLSPQNPGIDARIARCRQEKELSRLRSIAVEALKAASRSETGRVATAAIELEQIWDRLAKTKLVREQLPPDQVKFLFAQLSVRRVRAEEGLVERGERGESLYLICGGEVEARAETATGPVTLRTFGPGDILGDSVLFEHASWPASLMVTTTGSLLVLDRKGLEGALQGNPDPRGLVSVLRSQRNDLEIMESIEKLGS